MKVSVVRDEVADKNPANQSTDGKHYNRWDKVAGDLVGQLLYRCLHITTSDNIITNL